MGRKSKASWTCLSNLRNCASKPYHPTVKEVSDTEDMNYMPRDDLDLVSEADVEEGEQEKFYVLVDSNRATQFISAYSQGLTGAEAAWANQKYHGHQILPPYMLEQVTKAFQNK